jgi:cytochrome c peroxidase
VLVNDDIWDDPLGHITFRQLGVPNYGVLVEDTGLIAVTKEDPDWGAFSYRTLTRSRPNGAHMHNGILATLEEVIAFYDARDDLGLTSTQTDQRVAFLESLSSEPVDVEIPILPDYQLRTLGENR